MKSLLNSEKWNWNLLDMHAHLSENQEEDLNYRKENQIYTCFSAGTPTECETLLRWKEKRRDEFCPTFGLHPWYADQYSFEDMMPYLKQADIIGEIGMDKVWCEVPLPIQREVFLKQLEYAGQAGKPIVLHTKEQEKEIFECIRDFPGNILVHWYSGPMDVFSKYLEKGCYFTIGPEMAKTENGRNMIAQIPLNRLFVETDGLEAVAWAKGNDQADLTEIGESLRESVSAIRRIKQVSFGVSQMKENYLSFVSI